MKVLFAVNNDSISNEIVKTYQREYKEIISYKNVYYFNAILKELQNNKNYDSVVISEDLEPFANNNFDTIDKFLFEKLDKISDEATKANGNNIEIILICSDRRSKSDDMLSKIFGIGIYNALIGDERTIKNLCTLINQPRNKKEAKIAYKIDGSGIGYQLEDENNVSEAEVQNILAHYKRLGKDEDKYVDSFNNIVSQYTDAQLKIIIRYLPMNVKAVLEEKSTKYQELATFSSEDRLNNYKYNSKNNETKKDNINVTMLHEEKDNITKPILIPSAINASKKKKIQIDKKETINNESINDEKDYIDSIEMNADEKKGRGRPKKSTNQEIVNKPKRGRGRPKKVEQEDADLFNVDKNENDKEEIDLFNVNEKENDEEEIDLFSMEDEIIQTNNKNSEKDNDIDLFGLDEDIDNNNESISSNTGNEDEFDLFNISEEENNLESSNTNNEENSDLDLMLSNDEPKNNLRTSNNETEYNNDFNIAKSIDTVQKIQETDLNSVITKDRKIVSFVGTTKNGTSFIVNNLALVLSSMNISTAILDLTKNKNSYYIYTNNDQKLRDIAENSFDNLESRIAKGIVVNKNLTVYTEVPSKQEKDLNVQKILTTLMENYNVVLIDSDFSTKQEFFKQSQEIYLVQSLDILTIQPLTEFLRNLKSKEILEQQKLKIIINKDQKVNGLTDKLLIGGMSAYNDPAMSYMTELFNKDTIMYCKIPFEIQNYSKYLASMVDCDLSIKGYTKQLINALQQLAEMVYPLIGKREYTPMGNNKKRMEFSSSTKNTLDKMKNNY